MNTVGVVASVYAGFALPELKRTASLLSSVVNGVATVLLGIAVEPAISALTQETLQQRRLEKDIYTLGVLLIASMLIGTLLSQALLEPAKEVILFGAKLLDQAL